MIEDVIDESRDDACLLDLLMCWDERNKKGSPLLADVNMIKLQSFFKKITGSKDHCCVHIISIHAVSCIFPLAFMNININDH